ncbi:MAG TPA: fused MFS/spermidine synthase [Beijerinckiaceae bacterium]|nr:fused MFS/spermidine synthase [Beijerinckiaceae bacterium]
MASLEPGYGTVEVRVQSGTRLLLAAFVAAIFTSAFLLFAVQPMFTRMVLPLLGGSPAVWSVAMVFFQTLLLAGYAYAHVLARYFSLKSGLALHLCLFALTALTLPIGIQAGTGEPPATGQELWLIGVFLVSVGLPFFAVSANGPLLQAWFARSSHPTAGDPYYLYGASNFGSFAALLLYPTLVEPLLSLNGQAGTWSSGFVVLAMLIAAAGIAALRMPGIAAAQKSEVAAPAPSWSARAGWVVLAMVPSGLLVAATAHLSTDVAASPFMWVIPLALYLATYMVVFRERLPFRMEIMERVVVMLGGALVLMIFTGEPFLFVSLALHLGFLTAATLVCHARLYQARPAPSHLTTFYFCMSLGGVLGGLFCGLIAPNIFSRVAEYPILIVAALACLPSLRTLSVGNWQREVLPWVGAVVTALGIKLAVSQMPGSDLHSVIIGLIVLLIFAAMVNFRRPLAAMVLVAGAFLMLIDVNLATRDILTMRSFFGVNKVQISNDGQFLRLTHGTTLHGTMRLREADGSPAPQRPLPLSYYYEGSPMSQTVRAAQGRAPAGAEIGVVGLGSGSIACVGRPEDRFAFFEIDPVVVQIAREKSLFRFLSECAPNARMVIGDARLTLAKDTQLYDMLLIDAFASDAIPVHLLTREAVDMYMRRIKPGGMLVMHISNRHLELSSVVAAIGQSLGLAGAVRFDPANPEEFSKTSKAGSLVTALVKDADTLKPLVAGGWKPFEPSKTTVWTDDYANIVGAMWRAYAN